MLVLQYWRILENWNQDSFAYMHYDPRVFLVGLLVKALGLLCILFPICLPTSNILWATPTLSATPIWWTKRTYRVVGIFTVLKTKCLRKPSVYYIINIQRFFLLLFLFLLLLFLLYIFKLVSLVVQLLVRCVLGAAVALLILRIRRHCFNKNYNFEKREIHRFPCMRSYFQLAM